MVELPLPVSAPSLSPAGMLVVAVGAELAAMAAGMLRLQAVLSSDLAGGDVTGANALSSRGCGGPGLAPGAALIVALQDLDRLSQTAAELGTLCQKVGRDELTPCAMGQALAAMRMRSLAARLSGQAIAPDDRCAPGTLQLFE